MEERRLPSNREAPPSYREGPTHAHAVNAVSCPREHNLPALESAIAHPSLPLNEREETRRSRVDNVGCALARGVAGRVEVEAVADERDEQVLIPWMVVAQSCEHCYRLLTRKGVPGHTRCRDSATKASISAAGELVSSC